MSMNIGEAAKSSGVNAGQDPTLFAGEVADFIVS